MRSPDADYWLALQDAAMHSWHFDPSRRQMVPPAIRASGDVTFVVRGVKPDPNRTAFHVHRSQPRRSILL